MSGSLFLVYDFAYMHVLACSSVCLTKEIHARCVVGIYWCLTLARFVHRSYIHMGNQRHCEVASVSKLPCLSENHALLLHMSSCQQGGMLQLLQLVASAPSAGACRQKSLQQALVKVRHWILPRENLGPHRPRFPAQSLHAQRISDVAMADAKDFNLLLLAARGHALALDRQDSSPSRHDSELCLQHTMQEHCLEGT